RSWCCGGALGGRVQRRTAAACCLRARLPADRGADGGADDGVGLPLGDQGVVSQGLDDLADVPGELSVVGVVGGFVDGVVDGAAVADFQVGDAGVDLCDHHGGSVVRALPGVGVAFFFHDREFH